MSGQSTGPTSSYRALQAEVERLKAELDAAKRRNVEFQAERDADEAAYRAEVDAALALADATQAELTAERERHHATAGRVERLEKALLEAHDFFMFHHAANPAKPKATLVNQGDVNRLYNVSIEALKVTT